MLPLSAKILYFLLGFNTASLIAERFLINSADTFRKTVGEMLLSTLAWFILLQALVLLLDVAS